MPGGTYAAVRFGLRRPGEPQRAPRARQGDVQEALALLALAPAQEFADVGIQASLLLRSHRRGGRDQKLARARIRGQVDPAQQRALAEAREAIERGHEHVLELQPLGAVDGHDLHRLRAAGRTRAVQIFQQRVEVRQPLPLPARRTGGERGEEGARVLQFIRGVGIGRAEAYPGGLQPLREVGARESEARLRASRARVRAAADPRARSA